MVQGKGMPEWGEDFIRKLDSLLYDKPKRNVMETIDRFFEQAKLPKQIPIDIAETDKKWIVKVDLPGITKDQIQLKILGSKLTIIVIHQEDKETYHEDYHYYQKERRQQRKERVVELPYPIDKRSIKARFEHGVLEITGDKVQIEGRSIEIN